MHESGVIYARRSISGMLLLSQENLFSEETAAWIAVGD